MTDRIYLDWNATAPLRPQARAAMATAMDLLGNPSSVHGEGRAARRLIEDAREKVAAAVGAEPRNVIFTSGGTEANALALSRNLELDGKGCCDTAIVSNIEHVSVLQGGDLQPAAGSQFCAGRDGVVSLSHLKERIREAISGGKAAPLVALMAANNETGVIQPVREAADIVHGAGGLLHVDAVQALGKMPIDIKALGADSVAISAHKIGGPMGVGALVLASDRLHFRHGSRFGGGQERNRRGGTENVVGIAGFGAAAVEAARDIPGEGQRLRGLCQRLEQGLREIWPATIIFGEQAPRVPNTVQFAVEGIKAQTGLIALDLQGVAVSSGSACSSGKLTFSTVVKSMGYDLQIAESAIRVSFGWTTKDAEIDGFLKAWRKLSQPLLKRREIAA
jgi:cysteine desulfurase